jgi:hypothetical protein
MSTSIISFCEGRHETHRFTSMHAAVNSSPLRRRALLLSMASTLASQTCKRCISISSRCNSLSLSSGTLPFRAAAGTACIEAEQVTKSRNQPQYPPPNKRIRFAVFHVRRLSTRTWHSQGKQRYIHRPVCILGEPPAVLWVGTGTLGAAAGRTGAAVRARR